MSKSSKINVPIAPWSFPSMALIPQRHAVIVTTVSPEAGVHATEVVLWSVAPDDPIARVKSRLSLNLGALGGGYFPMASNPELGLVAIGGSRGVLQLDAERLAPTAAWTISGFRGAEALAFSPNARYLAVSTVSIEHVALVGLDTAEQRLGIPIGVSEKSDVERPDLVSPIGSMEGGEYTDCLTFSPDGQTIVAGCSYQGGTSIAIADVDVGALGQAGNEAGILCNSRELSRSDIQTPLSEFCDRVGSLSVSPSGQTLALYETAQLKSTGKSSGWRGVLSVADRPFGAVRWSIPIDASSTGDVRPIELFGSRTHGGFFTDVVFVSENEVACGATAGQVLCFDVRTGRLTRTIKLPARYGAAEVRRLVMNRTPNELWCCVILGDAYQVLCLDPRP